jgi:hypothetical protein
MSGIPCRDFELAVERFGEERGFDVDKSIFCREVVDRSELLFQNKEGEYEFKHRTFQDYFVGAEINSQLNPIGMIVENLLDPWWTQAIFFACGLRREKEDYLEAIMDQVQVSGPDYLVFAISLGLMAQAAYLAPKQAKREAVECALENFTEAWDSYCAFWAEVEDEDKPDSAGHISSLILFCSFARAALGSITLLSVLSDLAREYSFQPPAELSGREKAKREWYAYLVAMACAECGDVASFAEVFESGVIEDPTFWLFGHAQADHMAERTWLPKEDRSRARDLAKKLKKKLGRRKTYFTAIRDSDPIPLPPPDASDDE